MNMYFTNIHFTNQLNHLHVSQTNPFILPLLSGTNEQIHASRQIQTATDAKFYTFRNKRTDTRK